MSDGKEAANGRVSDPPAACLLSGRGSCGERGLRPKGETIISLTLFALVFAAILKVLPDVNLLWSDVWEGGVFIAVLFVIGKYLIAIYWRMQGRLAYMEQLVLLR
jgi:hypothetical protein